MREILRAIRFTLILWVLVAVIYPFSMLAIGQVVFPHQANGSLLKNAQGQVIGSTLIGQPFASDRYFHSRPSTSSYSTADPKNDSANLLKTGVSGASNLAPSNPDLAERIQTSVKALKRSGIQPSADLVYTSGSSLDPHITPATAKAQVDRVATTRGLQPNQVEILVASNTEGRFLGIFGEPGVNVLKLNLALDALKL